MFMCLYLSIKTVLLQLQHYVLPCELLLLYVHTHLQAHMSVYTLMHVHSYGCIDRYSHYRLLKHLIMRHVLDCYSL